MKDTVKSFPFLLPRSGKYFVAEGARQKKNFFLRRDFKLSGLKIDLTRLHLQLEWRYGGDVFH